MSASSRPAADAVVVAHGELHRLDPLEVRLVERRPRPGLHARGDAGDPRDRVDRVTEEVAVVHPRAAAELAHRLADTPARRACRPSPPAVPGRAAPRGRDPRPTRRAGACTSSNARSGNCASSARTSRAAVSPVESERMWSSTGTWSVTAGRLPGSVGAPWLPRSRWTRSSRSRGGAGSCSRRRRSTAASARRTTTGTTASC